MTLSMVKYFAQKNDELADQLNIIPGYVEPADMREIKRILAEMNIPAVVFPDTCPSQKLVPIEIIDYLRFL